MNDQPDQSTTPNASQSDLARVADAIVAYVRGREEREAKANTWKSLSRGVLGLVVISFLVFYVFFYGRMFGVNLNASRAAIAVIPVHGPIAASGDASAEVVVPMIQKACASRSVQTLVIEINSPGGSPSESERIIDSIKACQAEHKKPVIALIDQIGASAGYMIAVNTDRIVAGRYTIVGSIGAIMRYIDASEAATKLGLHEEIFKSGPLKGGPTNLSGGDEALDAVNQEMVEKLGRTFLEDVYQHRNGRLTVDKEELFSGRIWTAEESLKLGLIDEIGTLESLSAGEWKDLRVQRYVVKSGVARSMGFSTRFKDWVSTGLQELSAPRVE